MSKTKQQNGNEKTQQQFESHQSKHGVFRCANKSGRIRVSLT